MAYTNIDDPSAYFQTATYTGNGGTQSITNDGNSDLQSDLLWIKSRSDSSFHAWTDSTRGTSKRLYSNSTAAEESHTDRVTAFNSDGFSLGASSLVNTNTYNYAAWQWKANGGTTATNSDGSTDTTVQANTDAGFSIVTFTTDGGNETYGHGLGVKPDIVIVKSRSGGGSWIYMTDVIDGSVDYLLLNGTNAAADLSYGAFTSSTFQYNDNNAVTQIAYCFAEKQGYSKFSSYKGNGNANGTFIYTGFKPEFVIVKRSDSTNNWIITDNARGINSANPRLYADLADSEGSAADYIDHLSNGFKIRTSAGSMNTNGGTYIYMAFAENPFTTSTGIPTTAR
jgi:hypothetical protein